jgi:hypothetical protein
MHGRNGRYTICHILARKAEEKRPVGKLRRSWEDNIKLDLNETGSVLIET